MGICGVREAGCHWECIKYIYAITTHLLPSAIAFFVDPQTLTFLPPSLHSFPQGQQACHPHSMFCSLSAPHRSLGGSKLLPVPHWDWPIYQEALQNTWSVERDGFVTVSLLPFPSQLRSCTSAQVDSVTNYNSPPRRPNEGLLFYIFSGTKPENLESWDSSFGQHFRR